MSFSPLHETDQKWKKHVGCRTHFHIKRRRYIYVVLTALFFHAGVIDFDSFLQSNCKAFLRCNEKELKSRAYCSLTTQLISDTFRPCSDGLFSCTKILYQLPRSCLFLRGYIVVIIFLDTKQESAP